MLENIHETTADSAEALQLPPLKSRSIWDSPWYSNSFIVPSESREFR